MFVSMSLFVSVSVAVAVAVSVSVSVPPEVRACRRDGYCLMHVLVFNLTEGFIDTLCRRKSTDVTTFDTVTLLVVVL